MRCCAATRSPSGLARASEPRRDHLHAGAIFSLPLDGWKRREDGSLMLQSKRQISWFALAAAFQIVWVIAASVAFGALRPGYSASHAISELGAQGSVNALAWNLIGFGGSAVLYALFATAIAAGFGRGWLFRLTVIEAIALAASGVFSCDPGCPAVMATPQGWLHTVGGLTYFGTATIVPFVAFVTFRRRTEWQSLATFSLVIGVFLAALFIAGPFLFGADRVGIWQRTTFITVFVWAAVVGYRLFGLLRQTEAPSREGLLEASR
jgi:hypothetical protein